MQRSKKPLKQLPPKKQEQVDSAKEFTNLLSLKGDLPSQVLLLPVSQTTLFPGMMVPFILPEGKLTQTIEEAEKSGGYVGVVLLKEGIEATVAMGPTTSMSGIPAEGTIPNFGTKNKEETFYRFGVTAKVVKKINLPDNQVSVLLTGMQRFKIVDCIYQKPLYVSNVEYIYDEIDRNDELEALLRTAMTQFKQISKENPLVSEEIKLALINIDSPGKLADFMSSVLVRDVKDYQSLLSMSDVKDRYLHLLLLLKKELELQGVQKKMQEEINQKVTHNQREFYLQEQLKFIQKELGKDTTEKSKWVDKFKKRLKGKTLPDFAQSRFNEEIEKLGSLNDHSAEFSVSLNYLDWFTSMPWGSRSSENYDLEKSKQTLDADHYGLKDIKDRVLEYLAVRNLKK